jgi:hypothetical protein
MIVDLFIKKIHSFFRILIQTKLKIIYVSYFKMATNWPRGIIRLIDY